MLANANKLTSQEIVGLTIIGEARGEPIEGQVAVGCVIRNRLHRNPGKYKTYSDVCLEPMQFSCWNSNDPNSGLLHDLADKMITGQKLDDPYLRQCLWVAVGITEWSLLDNTFGSEYYMTRDLFYGDSRPKWAKVPSTSPTIINHHVFFNV